MNIWLSEAHFFIYLFLLGYTETHGQRSSPRTPVLISTNDSCFTFTYFIFFCIQHVMGIIAAFYSGYNYYSSSLNTLTVCF